MIILWHGAIGNIPEDYALCDGNNGTPDLRNFMVPGAGSAYAVGASGGSDTHLHGKGTLDSYGPATTDSITTGTEGGVDLPLTGHQHVTDGSVASQDGRPQYYSLAYIMRL